MKVLFIYTSNSQRTRYEATTASPPQPKVTFVQSGFGSMAYRQHHQYEMGVVENNLPTFRRLTCIPFSSSLIPENIHVR